MSNPVIEINGNGNAKRVVGTPSAESILLYNKLHKLEENQSMTYDELNALIPGASVREKHRYWLKTAIKLCELESVFIRCVPRVGVMRVTDSEESTLWKHVTTRCQRMTKRGRKRLARVKFDKLNDGDKKSYYVGLSVLGAAELFFKPKHQHCVEDRVTNKALTFDETIQAFKK